MIGFLRGKLSYNTKYNNVMYINIHCHFIYESIIL